MMTERDAADMIEEWRKNCNETWWTTKAREIAAWIAEVENGRKGDGVSTPDATEIARILDCIGLNGAAKINIRTAQRTTVKESGDTLEITIAAEVSPEDIPEALWDATDMGSA